jgi:hypothetical protein
MQQLYFSRVSAKRLASAREDKVEAERRTCREANTTGHRSLERTKSYSALKTKRCASAVIGLRTTQKHGSQSVPSGGGQCPAGRDVHLALPNARSEKNHPAALTTN